jgi:hypothetical protein
MRCDSGYDLMFNRDESWSRSAALLPRLIVRNQVRILMPIDADAGGTWLGVNAFGLSVGLLNRYQDSVAAGPVAAEPSARWISRGQLVRSMLDARNTAEVADRAESLELNRFQPFTLIVIQPNTPALLLEWNGRGMQTDANADHVMPLASSSFDTSNALAYRSALLKRLSGAAPSVDTLRRFHAMQEPGRAAYGPCMERDDAHTVSFSWISVRPDAIRFEYTPRALCDAHAPAPFAVSIAPAAAYHTAPRR